MQRRLPPRGRRRAPSDSAASVALSLASSSALSDLTAASAAAMFCSGASEKASCLRGY